MTKNAQNNDSSSDLSLSFEDAQRSFGPHVIFTIVPEDNNYNAEDAVNSISQAPANTVAVFEVPKNKVNDFTKAVKTYLTCQSRRVIEKAGRVSFWRGKEPYMRPVLSRSLSLP